MGIHDSKWRSRGRNYSTWVCFKEEAANSASVEVSSQGWVLVPSVDKRLLYLSDLIPGKKHRRARISLFEHGLVPRNTNAESISKVRNVLNAFDTDFEDEEDMFVDLQNLPEDTLILMDVY